VTFSEHVVSSNGIDIAVREHGGNGRPVVLLHGGGRTMDDWRQVVPPLAEAGVRVVTADLRGHGRSGAALWSWQAAIDDLTAVIADRGLTAPAIVGHSLGGLVAAVWATRHPECPLAINLDGHTNPTGPFEGIDADAARRTMRGFLDASLEQAADPALTRLIEEFDALDLFATYAATRCPLVVVSSAGLGEELLPPDVAEAFAAYQRGFARALNAVATETPLLRLVDVPTSHDVHLEAPDTVVRLILGRDERGWTA
jgi:pimeloyl-ACP methyl ester carboxylesterase